jgi:putative transposase
MGFDPKRHHRRSIRLKGYDYSQPGAYFLTICTYRSVDLFGRVKKGRVVKSQHGKIAADEWIRTAKMRTNVELDVYVVMPNHFYGIMVLTENHVEIGGRTRRAQTDESERFGKPRCGSLPTIVRAFKAAVTKRVNRHRGTPGFPVWQRNYYEHIVRDDDELDAIRKYITENPVCAYNPQGVRW